MSDTDVAEAIASLKHALRLLQESSAPGHLEQARQAAEAAARAIPRAPKKEWQPHEELQINRVVKRMLAVQYAQRPEPNRWQAYRERSSRRRLRRAMFRVRSTDVLEEAELRYWKASLSTAVLMEFLRCPQASGLRTRVGFVPEGRGVGVEKEEEFLSGVP